MSAGQLINRVCNKDSGAESIKALVLSLVQPFLYYLNQQYLEVETGLNPSQNQQVDSMIILLASNSLFDTESLKLHDEMGMVSLTKLYLKLFKNLKNSNSRAAIKATFVEKTAGIISGNSIGVLMKEIKQGLFKASELKSYKE